jgi:hypothetical protein
MVDKKYTTEVDKVPERANTQNSNGSAKGDYYKDFCGSCQTKEGGDVMDPVDIMKERSDEKSAM